MSENCLVWVEKDKTEFSMFKKDFPSVQEQMLIFYYSDIQLAIESLLKKKKVILLIAGDIGR